MTGDALLRLSAFVGVMAAMACWELLAPRRPLATSKLRRWVANLAVVALDTLLVRVLFAAGAVGMAAFAAEHGWGLLNRLDWPLWIELALALVALDLAMYLQHVMFHAAPLLWRVHMMHHADLDVDVTTGARFHPVEVALSMLIKLAAVMVIGPAPTAVIAFEVLLNATSLFNHSNVRVPNTVERVLRWLVVTPDMHRIHHSIDPRETNRNFGFNLPWWDYLFGTYRAEPARGHDRMPLGVEHYRDPARLALIGMLALPFVAEPGNYPLGRANSDSSYE
jgi:sterol desaturase/sphingolipid hydroxylase (fatty acid hydroxylase superfamily)